MRHVATGQITLLDSNDYLSTGLTAPSNPVAGVTLWVDTSVTPNQLKKWNGTAWEIVSDAQAAIDKAKQDAINDAAQKYVTNSTFSTNFTQLSDRINTKVSQTDFNALGTRVGNAETKIAQQSTLISAKAEKTDLNALSTRVSNAEAKITPDAINLTVKSQITTAVNDVQIGGRNLLLSSKTSKSGSSYNIGYWTCSRDFIVGETLTVTIKGNIPGSKQFGIWFNSGSYGGYALPKISDGLYSKTITVPTGTSTRVIGIYLIGNQSAGDSWSFEWIKLESGNKATDWTPAPEDVDASIALRPTTEEIKSQFTMDSSGISMMGKKIALTGLITFSSLASDAQTKITSAQSTANQALGSISNLSADIGAMAYYDNVSLAKLDSTIVEGGYIKTSLIDANAIITGSLLAAKIAATDITTNRLTIGAGARIGDLYIYDGGLNTNQQGLVAMGENYMGLSRSALSLFYNNYSTQGAGWSRYLSARVAPGSLSVKCVTSNSNFTDPGLQIEVSGNSDNTAINILAGHISGFRLKMRTVTTSQTLSVADGIIISEANSTITLTLPSSPGNGKMYFIRKNGGGRVYIAGSYIVDNGDWYSERSTSVYLDRGGLGVLIYNGTYWTYNNING